MCFAQLSGIVRPTNLLHRHHSESAAFPFVYLSSKVLHLRTCALVLDPGPNSGSESNLSVIPIQTRNTIFLPPYVPTHSDDRSVTGRSPDSAKSSPTTTLTLVNESLSTSNDDTRAKKQSVVKPSSRGFGKRKALVSPVGQDGQDGQDGRS